jgi:uncharacterized small protein (DUF1192 family)
MTDYTEVFKAETEKLIELNLLPATGLTEADNMRIINELDARIALMNDAIEQLRTRKHSALQAKRDHELQLPLHKQKEVAERDMIDRQKKQAVKMDKAVQLKRAKAQGMTKAMEAAGCSPEEIRSALMKVGLL